MEFCLLQIKINNKNQKKAPGVQITPGAFSGSICRSNGRQQRECLVTGLFPKYN